jgi:hypothetical protein
LVLLVLFYPIALTKLLHFAPVWLLFLMLLFHFCEARTSVVLSLFLPITAGVMLRRFSNLANSPHELLRNYFGPINLKMIAIPSSALDFYNDFFSTHEITLFCQVSFFKPLAECPYSDPLSIVMERTDQLGNFNASLFATEGIASVGLFLAPFSGLACGIVIALGNRLSAGLPSTFILLSGGYSSAGFLNVPLSTTLLTNGAFVLFLMSYVTPREILNPN